MTTKKDWLIGIATAGFTVTVVLCLPLIIRALLAISGKLP